MLAVDHNHPPPPQLVTLWNCKRYNTMPYGGGYYDQPYMVINQMNIADNVYTALSKMRGAVGDQIHALTPQDRKILGPLVKQGLI